MSTSFQIDGTVKLINEVQTFASGFSKREFVIEVADGNYPQLIKFELLKDKATMIEEYGQGDPIRVHFDIRGNEYNGKYYNNLNAWRLERPNGGGGGAPQQGAPARGAAPAAGGFASDQDAPPSHSAEPPGGYGQDSDDDIPF